MSWEVKTMQSGTSCSKAPNPWWNAALLRKNATRFWPIWGAYGAALLLMPLLLLTDGLNRTNYAYSVDDIATGVLAFACPIGLVLAAVFSILAAMAVFSYLYNPRSVGLMHSLPIRREGLFLTNYVSGLAFMVVPQVVVFLLTLGVSALLGAVSVGALIQWLLSQICFVLFFYSFAVFCAMFTGNILALPVFYGILNFLAGGLYLLLNQLLQQFVYGYYGSYIMEKAAYWLTPALVFYRAGEVGATGGGGYRLYGLHIILLYALVGLVLAGAALAVYRRRSLETAGDVVSVRWVRPVFKYGVAFCVAVTLGQFLYFLFNAVLPGGIWPMLCLILLSGLIGYFASEMLLRKSFRVFAKSWKGGLALCLVLVGACCVMDFDLLGFNRAPSADRVAAVQVSGLNTWPSDDASNVSFYFTDPAEIQAVLDLHSTIARERRELQEGLISGWNDYEYGEYKQDRLYLYYEMTDGSSLSRRYELPLYLADLSDPESITAQIAALAGRRDLVEQQYFGGIPGDAELVEVSIDSVFDTAAATYNSVTADNEADREALLAAVKADLAAGRIGKRFLFEDAERRSTCYTANLRLIFYRSSTVLDEDGKPYDRSWDDRVEISLQTTATETLKCLTELGLIDDAHILVTHDQDVSEYETRAETNAAGEAEEWIIRAADEALPAEAAPRTP